MPCPEALHLQAYFDAEMDAVAAVEVERHLESCADCRRLLEELERTRSALRALPAPSLTSAQRVRLDRALDAEDAGHADGDVRARLSPFWRGALSGVGAGAVAAALALLVILPSPSEPLLDELIADHVRSLMPAHLIDVESTDQHTVKPWFAGHTDVSPVVADFTAQGYRLVGGRADYLLRQRAAVVVYAHGRHLINVFSWADTAGSVPRDTTHRGYHLRFWRAGGLRYCAVSDTGWNELRGLVSLLQERAAQDAAGS